MTTSPTTSAMTYHPLSFGWIAPGAVLGFLVSFDPHWGSLLGPAISVFGSLGGVLLKWWLDRRRFRQAETIRLQKEEIEKLQKQLSEKA